MTRKTRQQNKPKTAHHSDLGPIVSSIHLAQGIVPSLSEFEFGLIMAFHAFERWMVRATSAAGCGELSALDVLVLHSINHREREKKLADICLVLNIEDTHTVSYALKKLERLELIESGRIGKEKTASITDEGRNLCERYKQIREQLLEQSVKDLGIDQAQFKNLSILMRTLSGQYDQATRTAASL
ncbi:MAG: winged helix DNA-binding protein [Methyloligellaceae bacterium]